MFDDFYRGKRVLITGHTGFKGSWLAQWILKLGGEVCGYSIDIPTQPSHFHSLGLEGKLQHRLGDVRDFERLSKAFEDFRPEVVFHLAAQPIVTVSFEDPLRTFSTNLMGTVNVLEAIRHTSSVKCAVICTSDKCYENIEWEFGYRETDQLGGKDPYSASKACAEIAFSAYYRSYLESKGTHISTVRAGNVIGGGDWAKDRIVPDCIRAWEKGESCAMRAPHATRPWQHVLEPLSGYLWLVTKLENASEEVSGQSFNFGPPDGVIVPVAKLIEAMADYWPGVKWHTDPSADLTQKREAGLLKLNCDRAAIRLGWQPTLTFAETMQMTAQWYFTWEKGRGKLLTLGQISAYEELAATRRRVFSNGFGGLSN